MEQQNTFPDVLKPSIEIPKHKKTKKDSKTRIKRKIPKPSKRVKI